MSTEADKKEAFDNAQRAESARANLAEARALAGRGDKDARRLAADLCRHTSRMYERIGEPELAKKAIALAREYSGRTGR